VPVSIEGVLEDLGRRPGPAATAAPALNLGCGSDVRAGFVNLDSLQLPGVDVVASLEGGRLPFGDDTFSLVLCRDVLEHVEVVAALREVYRILRPGGHVVVSAVHFTSRNLYVDPTHVRGYSARTFDFFAAGARQSPHPYYFDFAFAAVELSQIQFHSLLGKGRWFLWDRLVEPIVNTRRAAQDLFEMTFVSRMFPAANVLAVLRK
jgi:SAM-dependent methyltransferase